MHYKTKKVIFVHINFYLHLSFKLIFSIGIPIHEALLGKHLCIKYFFTKA